LLCVLDYRICKAVRTKAAHERSYYPKRRPYSKDANDDPRVQDQIQCRQQNRAQKMAGMREDHISGGETDRGCSERPGALPPDDAHDIAGSNSKGAAGIGYRWHE